MLYRVHLAWAGFKLTMLVVIGADCIGSYKSNYHTITTMIALYHGQPFFSKEVFSYVNVHYFSGKFL